MTNGLPVGLSGRPWRNTANAVLLKICGSHILIGTLITSAWAKVEEKTDFGKRDGLIIKKKKERDRETTFSPQWDLTRVCLSQLHSRL